MTGQSPTARARGPARRGWTLFAAIAAATLAGCSSVPDAANPVEWYRGAEDWVSGEENPKAAKSEKPVPGADKDFPKLSTVPERPHVSPEAERARAAARLRADRERARYTDQRIRLQSDTAPRPLPPPAPPPAPSPPPSAGTSPVAPPPEPPPPPEIPSPQSFLMGADAGEQIATRAPMAGEPSLPTPFVPASVDWSAQTDVPERPMQLVGGIESEGREPSRADPPAAGTYAPPPPTAPPQVSRPAISGGTAPAPGGPLTFGPPPGDIAAVQQGGIAPSAVARPGDLTAVPRVNAGLPPPRTAALTGAAAGREIATVYFAAGSARIDAVARRAIRQAAEQQKARGGTLYVVGHASSRTRNMAPVRHHMVNFQVSLDRANAVTRELVRQGVDRDAIVMTAVSDSDPMFYEAMPAGEAGNRRAVIMLAN